ncbi:hypothetical protein Tco_1094646 [Tanacetum coccineum]|uniref:Reverse transcriptase domain-containing protein n=1 Tax=Tanacetum coccineum TaxID=301880 RepID=A0ABQ5III8_9ASTR
MRVLKCFEEVSGLKVNHNKSKIYGIGVSEGDMTDMARWMGCGIGEFPFTYLRLPIDTDISKITRKQLKAGKHGHENQKSTKRSQRIKAEAAVKSSQQQ